MTEEEWLECSDPMRMVVFLRGKVTDRKWRLFACTCCRHILPHLGAEPWQRVLQVAERYADGIAGDRERLEAVRDVKDQLFPPTTSWKAAVVQYGYDLFKRCLDKRVRLWCKDAIGSVDLPCWSVTHDLDQQTRSDQWATLKEGEDEWHVSILDEIFGNPFRPVSLNPTWRTQTVTSLATAAYEERALPSGELDTSRLAVLADALEEAGCANADMLTHLRSPGPHVRGCWVVDLLLGKE